MLRGVPKIKTLRGWLIIAVLFRARIFQVSIQYFAVRWQTTLALSINAILSSRTIPWHSASLFLIYFYMNLNHGLRSIFMPTGTNDKYPYIYLPHHNPQKHPKHTLRYTKQFAFVLMPNTHPLFDAVNLSEKSKNYFGDLLAIFFLFLFLLSVLHAFDAFNSLGSSLSFEGDFSVLNS